MMRNTDNTARPSCEITSTPTVNYVSDSLYLICSGLFITRVVFTKVDKLNLLNNVT